MERLLLLDANDYDEDMDEWARVAVRGIVFIGDKLLLLDDNKDEVSLPGGGQDEGESDADTLIREIREETGYSVIPDTIRPFGYIEEKRRDFKSYHESRIFHQISRLYFCEGPLIVEKRSSASRKNDMVCVLHCTPLMKR